MAKQPGTKKPTKKPNTGAAPIGAKIPAKFLKPLAETPLTGFASGVTTGPMLIGAGLAAGGQAVLANLMYNLGYATVEEALGVLQVAKREFIRRFALAGSVVDSFIESLIAKATPVPAEVLSAITARPFTFGFVAESAHRPLRAPNRLVTVAPLPAAPTAGGDGGLIGGAGGGLIGGVIDGVAAGAGMTIGAGLPAGVDLRGELPNAVRDQGARNSCIAHAVLVAYEHYLWRNKVGNPVYDLSEQFFFWNCKRRDTVPTNPAGTFMWAALAGLEADGVCQESDWPYDPSNARDLAGDVGHNPPPSGWEFAAAPFRPTRVYQVTATSVDEYKRLLVSGRCAAFAVPIFKSFWDSPSNIASGKITLPLPGEDANGGHAMCIVGYQDDASIPALGGGRFIIRNSHGERFGATGLYGPGYGTIPYSYITDHGREFGIAFE